MRVREIPAPHNGHHALSPSSAHRWWHCAASVWLEEKVREVGVEMPANAAAIEGTNAHEEAEQVLLGFQSHCEEYPQAQEYVDYVREWLEEPLIEVNLTYHDFLPGSGGTADAVGVQDGVCHVIDLKYGMGKVEAKDNLQGKLYLLGALTVLPLAYGKFDRMMFHIVQPRIGWVDRVEYTVEEITRFGQACQDWYIDTLTANELTPNPGEAQCRWCDAAGICKARAERMMDIAMMEFSKVMGDE